MKTSQVFRLFAALAFFTALTPARAVVGVDGEGIGAIWRMKFNAAGLTGAADADGDGKSNADEAKAGTDPWSPTDIIKVTDLSLVGGNLEVRWPSIIGKRYKVQSNTDLSNAAGWSDATGFLDGSGATIIQAFPATGAGTFYRIAVYEKDSDGDGVDEWEEVQLGMDPENSHSHGLSGQSDQAFVTAGLAATNVVTVAAQTPTLAETSLNPGVFSVVRTGGFAPLTVQYAVSGGATSGSDYTALSGTVVIPMSASSATISVTPIADAAIESSEALVVTLTANAAYTVGQPAAAGILITDNVTATGDGLRAQFWNEGPLSDTVAAVFPGNPLLSRVDSTLDFYWASGTSPSSPATTITHDNFSSRWSGEVLPEFAQIYTFSYLMNRAGRLWVNGQLLVNNWPPATVSSATYTGVIALEAGKRYPIVVEQYDNSGNAEAHLSWSSANQTSQIIPQARLFSTVPPQITSALETLTFIGGPTFNYQITASANPTSYSAANLPPGLSINAAGLISGTPSQVGNWQVVLTATNATGSGSAILDLDILQAGGGITREVWTGITGTSVATLPLGTTPNSSSILASMQAPVNVTDDYGVRIRGYVTIPTTGVYRFFLRADDAAELYVSDDEDPVNAFKRAELLAPTSGADWTGAAQTDLLYLKSGFRYYIEVRHKEGTGTDHVAVGWSKPGQADTTPSEVIPGYLLTRYEDVPLGVADGTLFYTNMIPQGGTVTNAYGTCSIRLSTDQTVAYVTPNYSGLGSAFQGMHVHDDRLPTGANIVFDLDEPGVEHTADGAYVWPMVNVGALTATQIATGLGTNAYFNVHSVNYPNGEIKGYFKRLDGSQTFTPPPTAPNWTAESGTANTDATAAARFLSQATYGYNAADLTTLQTSGSYDAWIDAQFALPLSDTYTDVYKKRNVSDPNSPSYGGDLMFNSWWKTAIAGQDQLRQRVAFALSEILVTSESGPLDDRSDALSAYYDLLIKHSLGVDGDLANYPGNFRPMIEAVTLQYAMGRYLDMLRNDKPNKATGLIPNENYAREIMQLFTVGLNRLHPDGSLVLNSKGLPVPTYDQDAIVGVAHVFTGWDYGYVGALRTTFGASTNYLGAMREVPARHFTGQKRTLNNRVMPGITTAGGLPLDPFNTATPSVAQLADPIFQALPVVENDIIHDQLFNHPNCGPFICRQLIQRLVTSTPSVGYIYRVVSKFNDNGSGVRGDMRAVVKAILLDYEARSLVAKGQQGYGKQREPVIRVTNLARAFRPVTSFTGNYVQDGGLITVDTTPYAHRITGTPNVEIGFSSTGTPSQSGIFTLTGTFPPTATTFNVRTRDTYRGTWAQTGNTITVTANHPFVAGGQAFVRWRTGATALLVNGLFNVDTVPSAGATFTVTSPDSATVVGGTCDVAFVRGSYSVSGGVMSLTFTTDLGLAVGGKVYLTFTPITGQTTLPVTGAPSGLYTLAAPLASSSPLYDPRRYTATPDVGTLSTSTLSGLMIGAAQNPILDRGSLVSGTDIATSGYSDFTVGSSDTNLAQTPMRSPTVFNYFLPDYQFPGVLQDNGLITPEFELSSETNVTRQANFLYSGIFGTFTTGGLNGFGGQDIMMDFAPWIGLRPSTATYWTDTVNLNDLIDEMSKLLMASSMSAAMKTSIYTYVSNTATNYLAYTTPTSTETQRRDRLRAVLQFITTSSEFTIQK